MTEYHVSSYNSKTAEIYLSLFKAFTQLEHGLQMDTMPLEVASSYAGRDRQHAMKEYAGRLAVRRINTCPRDRDTSVLVTFGLDSIPVR